MTALPAKPDPTRALLAPSEHLQDWLKRRLNALTADFSPWIPEALALDAAQRATVEEMAARLDAHLSGSSTDDVVSAVAQMRVVLPTSGLDEGQAAAAGRAYLIALEGAPRFALQEAVRLVLRGEAGLDHRFMPTPPELKALVDRLSLPARAHRVQLRRLLKARVERVPTEEERAKVKELTASLVASLAPKEGERVRRRHLPNPAGVDHSVPYPIMKGE